MQLILEGASSFRQFYEHPDSCVRVRISHHIQVISNPNANLACFPSAIAIGFKRQHIKFSKRGIRIRAPGSSCLLRIIHRKQANPEQHVIRFMKSFSDAAFRTHSPLSDDSPPSLSVFDTWLDADKVFRHPKMAIEWEDARGWKCKTTGSIERGAVRMSRQPSLCLSFRTLMSNSMRDS